MEAQICSFPKCDRLATSLCKTCQATYLCSIHIQEHADSTNEDHLIKSISKRFLNEISLIRNLEQAKAKIDKAKENTIKIFANCIENLEFLFQVSMDALQFEADKIRTKIECILNGENLDQQEADEYLNNLSNSLLEAEVYPYKIFEAISNVSKIIGSFRSAELRNKCLVVFTNELNCVWKDLKQIEEGKKITLKVIISNGLLKTSKEIDAYSDWKISALIWKVNTLCGISAEESIITCGDFYLDYDKNKNLRFSESIFASNETIYILLNKNNDERSDRADCTLFIDQNFQKRDIIILYLESNGGLRWTIELSIMAKYSELASSIYFAFGIKTEDQRINHQGKWLSFQDFKNITLKDLNFKNYSTIQVCHYQSNTSV